MKKISTLILLVSITFSGFTQSVDLRRKIEVNGIAEKEVTPDIINVSISLKEYMDGKTRVTIDQLQSQLEKAVNEAGIPKADFTIKSVSSYYYATLKKKDPGFLASKQYNIRFHDLNRFDQIMSKLDVKGLQLTNIDSYDYSKIEELKNELKLKALLAAKDKATYLLNGLGEKIGGAISIVENEDNSFPVVGRAMYLNGKDFMNNAVSVQESDIDIKPIKLSYQIHAVFEIGK